MRTVAALLLLFSAFTTPQAKSAVVRDCAYACDEDTAKYLGDGIHTLYDVRTGAINHYLVAGWGEQPITFDGGEGVVVQPIALPTDAVQAFNFARHLYVMVGSTTYPVSVDTSQLVNDVLGIGAASVYDVN